MKDLWGKPIVAKDWVSCDNNSPILKVKSLDEWRVTFNATNIIDAFRKQFPEYAETELEIIRGDNQYALIIRPVGNSGECYTATFAK